MKFGSVCPISKKVTFYPNLRVHIFTYQHIVQHTVQFVVKTVNLHFYLYELQHKWPSPKNKSLIWGLLAKEKGKNISRGGGFSENKLHSAMPEFLAHFSEEY